MHAIYELKETLCKELEEYGDKGKLDVGGLDIVDKLAHTIKNLDKIIEKYEEQENGYSGRYYYNDGMNNRSYNDGYNSRVRYSRRDGMGRYSRDGGMINQLKDLMDNAPDDRTRQEIKRLIDKMEQM